MASIAIRPIAAGDKAEWRALWVAYRAFYGAAAPEEAPAATWDRRLGR